MPVARETAPAITIEAAMMLPTSTAMSVAGSSITCSSIELGSDTSSS